MQSVPGQVEAEVESTEQELQAQGNRATGQSSPAQPGRRTERSVEGSAPRAASGRSDAIAPTTAQLEEIVRMDNQTGEPRGITLMHERAEAVSAAFRLSSQPGTGARITVDYRG